MEEPLARDQRMGGAGDKWGGYFFPLIPPCPGASALLWLQLKALEEQDLRYLIYQMYIRCIKICTFLPINTVLAISFLKELV